MHVLSVNVGEGRELPASGKSIPTGIYKAPVQNAVWVGRLGLSGDFVGDTRHHGGADQAVYLYSAEEYDWWTEQLGEPLSSGTFGENLTLSTFGPSPVRIGDHFQAGEVVLEVTAPRIPCGTLAARMNDLGFVKKFREARRPGVYARVLREGEVRAGTAVARHTPLPQAPTIVEEFDAWFAKQPDPALLRRLLAAPIAERSRAWYEEQLRTLEANA